MASSGSPSKEQSEIITDTQTDMGVTTEDLMAALCTHHREVLQHMDEYFSQQQELITKVLAENALTRPGTRAASRPVTRKPSLTNKECVIAANVWNSRKAGTGGPEQSLHKQSEQTNSFQLPGSIEMEPVVPMPTPQPRSSHKLPQVGLETKLSSDPSLKQQGTRDTNGTLKKKIGERVAANRKKSWRQPPRKCLTKHGMELQTQDRSRTCLLPLLNSAWFDACSFTLIAAFSAYVILPLTTEVDCSANKGNFVIEVVFCVLFAVELILRMAPYGIKFFMAHDWMWNVVDTIIVAVTCVQIILEVVTADTTPANAMTFRMLRLFRAASTLRIARVFAMLRELRLLLTSVLGCMRPLFFSLMMLFAFIVLCSTFLTVGAQACLLNATLEQTEQVSKNFGTLSRSCVTLYMAISGGVDWGDKYWILEIVGWQYQLVYILYVSFAIFGLVNVFTGVFVDHAMQASSKDREIQIKNQIDEEDFNLKELQKVFQELDGNGSGKLSLEEFEDHLADERASAYFQAVKLDVTEVGRLFRLMDTDNSGSIDIEEFIIGCQRLKGESRSLDIKIALLEIESLQHEMRRLTNHFAERSVTSRGREYVVDSPR